MNSPRPPHSCRVRLAAASAALAAAALLGLAPPASAGADKYEKSSPWACVDWECLKSTVHKDNGQVWATARYNGTYAIQWTTIVLIQCDGYGRECGAKSSRNIAIVNGTEEGTSRKAYSPGHTYKACASGPSGSGLVNICTPLMSWNAK